MIRNYVVMDTQLQAPVGYMQLAVPPNLADGVFTHNDFELVKALAVEISWNCSFTMSPARPRAGQPMLRDYYVAPTRALNSLDIALEGIRETLVL